MKVIVFPSVLKSIDHYVKVHLHNDKNAIFRIRLGHLATKEFYATG